MEWFDQFCLMRSGVVAGKKILSMACRCSGWRSSHFWVTFHPLAGCAVAQWIFHQLYIVIYLVPSPPTSTCTSISRFELSVEALIYFWPPFFSFALIPIWKSFLHFLGIFCEFCPSCFDGAYVHLFVNMQV